MSTAFNVSPIANGLEVFLASYNSNMTIGELRDQLRAVSCSAMEASSQLSQKEALKTAKKAEKEALKSAKKAEKEAVKSAKKAEKEAVKSAKKAAQKAEKEAVKAEKKAAKEALKAEKKAEKLAAKKALKVALKAEKEVLKAAQKAEKEAVKAEKKAVKEALKAEKKAEKLAAKKAAKEAAKEALKEDDDEIEIEDITLPDGTNIMVGEDDDVYNEFGEIVGVFCRKTKVVTHYDDDEARGVLLSTARAGSMDAFSPWWSRGAKEALKAEKAKKADLKTAKKANENTYKMDALVQPISS